MEGLCIHVSRPHYPRPPGIKRSLTCPKLHASFFGSSPSFLRSCPLLFIFRILKWHCESSWLAEHSEDPHHQNQQYLLGIQIAHLRGKETDWQSELSLSTTVSAFITCSFWGTKNHWFWYKSDSRKFSIANFSKRIVLLYVGYSHSKMCYLGMSRKFVFSRNLAMSAYNNKSGHFKIEPIRTTINEFCNRNRSQMVIINVLTILQHKIFSESLRWLRYVSFYSYRINKSGQDLRNEELEPKKDGVKFRICHWPFKSRWSWVVRPTHVECNKPST